MIYTVTFNPALDYIVRLEKLSLGEVNRSEYEAVYYGGKGINVSTVLNNLAIPSVALGFVAGFTGKEIEDGVKKLGVQTDFIHLQDGMSRINVKIKAGEETEINGKGPHISQAELEQLYQKLDRLQKGDILVLAGTIPASLPADIYEVILGRLEKKEVEFVVDATGDLLKNVLKYHPFLIGIAKGKTVNSVGAGDSMVAGFLASYTKEQNYQKALKYGTAAGGATAQSEGLATIGLVEKLYKLL